MSDAPVEITTAGDDERNKSTSQDPEPTQVVPSEETESGEVSLSAKQLAADEPEPADVAIKLEPSDSEPVPSLEAKDVERKSAVTFETPKEPSKENTMDDSAEVPVISSEYQSYDDSPAKSSPPPTYENTSGNGSGERGAAAVIPSRYRPTAEADKNLADDLRRTADGKKRRTRRTTRRTPHYRIDADSDEDSNSSSVDEDYDVNSILSSIEEGLTWRGRMQHALHNHWFHIVIVVLVCLDALIVMFELLLDVGAFNNRVCYGETPIEQSEFCHYDHRDICGPLALQIIEHRNITPSHGTGEEDLCVCRYRGGKFVCDRADEPLGVNPALILHVFSLVILSIFMVEIILKMIAFRLKYFTHKFEVFDGMVVVVSWVLDIASIVEEEAFEAAALIIVLRLWRVVRIVNGAVLSAKAQSDRKLEEARTEARRIIHALHKCQDKLDLVEDEKSKLLKRVEASESGVKRPRGTDEVYGKTDDAYP